MNSRAPALRHFPLDFTARLPQYLPKTSGMHAHSHAHDPIRPDQIPRATGCGLVTHDMSYVAGSAEGLLVSAKGDILEGLVSNFFVVTLDKDGKPLVQTAPAEEGAASLVLDGVMRRLVLESCHMLHIPVQLALPSVKAASEWSEAFVTNSCVPRPDSWTVIVS